MSDPRPLVMHLVYSFDVGGLENGVVNLINRMPPERFRHMVVALTQCAPAFCARITRPDVEFLSLHKPPGQGYKLYPKLFRLFRQYRPAILHSRNLAALEAVVPAFAAGVPVRIHGEHGWEESDPRGLNPKFRFLRRLYRPFVSHYVALSADLERYLVDRVGIAAARVSRICNGVDTVRFHPANGTRPPIAGSPFASPDHVLIGTVGRLQAVKDQLTLVRAFARLAASGAPGSDRARLVIAGDGPLRPQVEAEVRASGCADRIWLAGERKDVPEFMRGLDVFVLPSISEGISNTILEAMASGLPVVATDVGGNGELVVAGATGTLVPAADPAAMADALMCYAADAALRQSHGAAGRKRVEAEFSLDGMVERYTRVYQSFP
ncbi:TIGR03088 family PEP-CTERM/XrtA system glycosyltransferase [Thauera sp. 2A1]|uniref:TIGR03088 family PEP-CTERM/XrtA system glycosyltransferase n=1 Tax=Thauera sp. 2A1 TaxID=2570191 RepID=UPI0012924C1D|nr:TIGR03088 family PEP-CTERM/XrtA system glycosyltransferase [Thauera sp. 2A1]KAI5916930.1 TIGR03088 family PEP-CTERM/XrtA system glycosyltransferase [Thauera sp. 2A1]